MPHWTCSSSCQADRGRIGLLIFFSQRKGICLNVPAVGFEWDDSPGSLLLPSPSGLTLDWSRNPNTSAFDVSSAADVGELCFSAWHPTFIHIPKPVRHLTTRSTLLDSMRFECFFFRPRPYPSEPPRCSGGAPDFAGNISGSLGQRKTQIHAYSRPFLLFSRIVPMPSQLTGPRKSRVPPQHVLCVNKKKVPCHGNQGEATDKLAQTGTAATHLTPS